MGFGESTCSFDDRRCVFFGSKRSSETGSKPCLSYLYSSATVTCLELMAALLPEFERTYCSSSALIGGVAEPMRSCFTFG